MRIKDKTLAGLAVCVLGVLATSSCSKDEFFGLEESVYLDNSLKTEIAMSQEFADYSIACLNLMIDMNQPVDTADMQIQGVVNGKPIYFKTGSGNSVKELYDNLLKAYPAMTKADKLDIDEIEEIAMSKNKALKKAVKATKYYSYNYTPYYQSQQWIYNQSQGFSDWDYYSDGWWFEAHFTVASAVYEVLWNCAEGGFYATGGGLLFEDNTAVTMIGYDEYWPSLVNHGSPYAERDFLVAPDNVNIYNLEVWDIARNLGHGYWGGNRLHYIFNGEMDYICFHY